MLIKKGHGLSKPGHLTIDHRSSPGLPEELANKVGQPAGSKLFEADTLTCRHCATVQIKNPLRTRERGFCPQCNAYICDNCEAARHQPDYVHKSWEQLVDEIQSATGTPIPILTPPK